MASHPPLGFDPIEEARRQWLARGWDDAADGMAALTSIVRVDQILQARVDRVLRPRGLTFARFELLVLLAFSRSGALPLGKIGARLQVHPASVTNAVNRLEADGLVVRIPHPEDGRTTLASITDAGSEVVAAATTELNDVVFADLGLDESELAALFALLHKMRANAGDFG